MPARTPSWVNSTVLIEALQRYEQNRLPRSLRLWLETTLDLEPNAPRTQLLPDLRSQD